MPRDSRPQEPSKTETPLMLKAAELGDELFRKLCKEDIFPRRSRWIMAGKIADLMNDYETAIDEANVPKVKTPALRDRRFEQQQIALGKLDALDKRITQAKRVFDANPNRLEYISKLIIENKRLLQAWINSDEKRYGPPGVCAGGLDIPGSEIT